MEDTTALDQMSVNQRSSKYSHLPDRNEVALNSAYVCMWVTEKKLESRTLRKLHVELFHSLWNYNWKKYELSDREKMEI